MLCGISDKSRCKQVFSKAETSNKCEVNNSTSQKRCKKKSIKKNPKINTKKKKCPPGKVLNTKTNRCIINRKK